MQLGFMTGCLPDLSLDVLMSWASENGYSTLEVSAWPGRPGPDCVANHLDVAHLDRRGADEVLELQARTGVGICALAYYDNPLHADQAKRERIHEHLRAAITGAELIGVDVVGLLVGRNNSMTVHESMRLAEQIIPPLVAFAADHGVRLVVENSPMLGAHPDTSPGNLAYSPELWEWMFGLGLYLNYDPSHLVWLGADPVEAVRPYLDRVLLTQAKDVEVDRAAKTRYGHFGRVIGRDSDWDSGWWKYRIPGRGEVDFRAVIDMLDAAGYAGAMTVEHEDAVWSGSPDRVKQGLLIAHRTLAPLIDGLSPQK